MRGFTLIEFLVVIAVVGVLISGLLAVINPIGQIQKARDTQRKQDLAQLQRALELYHNDNDHYPLQTDDIPWGNPWAPYMQMAPKDPLASQQYIYESVEEGAGYRLYAKLERCSDSQIIDGINCDSELYNYSVVSSNLAVRCYSCVSVPTVTLTPTITPTPNYKFVFVTSQTYTGDLKTAGSNVGLGAASDGADGADKICQSRANAAAPSPLGGTWKAWISINGSPASARLAHNTNSYKRLDGQKIADNWTDLTNGDNLSKEISITENGTLAPSFPGSCHAGGSDSEVNVVWTGTNPNGSYNNISGFNCAGWTIPYSDRNGVAGKNDSTQYWTTGCNIGCTQRARLYCFEQ